MTIHLIIYDWLYTFDYTIDYIHLIIQLCIRPRPIFVPLIITSRITCFGLHFAEFTTILRLIFRVCTSLLLLLGVSLPIFIFSDFKIVIVPHLYLILRYMKNLYLKYLTLRYILWISWFCALNLRFVLLSNGC